MKFYNLVAFGSVTWFINIYFHDKYWNLISLDAFFNLFLALATHLMLRKNVSLKIEYDFYDTYKYFVQNTLRCNWPEKYLYSENVKQK